MRFVVHESSGYLNPGPTRIPPCYTFTVLDTAQLYRVVGLYRSEDELGSEPGQLGGIRREQMRPRAQAKALAHAARLNAEYSDAT